jgi:hypothetical protein
MLRRFLGHSRAMENDEDLDRYFAALAAEGGTPPLTTEEVDAVLDLARIVAHTSERRFAPLTTYLAGLTIGVSGGGTDGAERAARIRALSRAAAGLRMQEEA